MTKIASPSPKTPHPAQHQTNQSGQCTQPPAKTLSTIEQALNSLLAFCTHQEVAARNRAQARTHEEGGASPGSSDRQRAASLSVPREKVCIDILNDHPLPPTTDENELETWVNQVLKLAGESDAADVKLSPAQSTVLFQHVQKRHLQYMLSLTRDGASLHTTDNEGTKPTQGANPEQNFILTLPQNLLRHCIVSGCEAAFQFSFSNSHVWVARPTAHTPAITGPLHPAQQMMRPLPLTAVSACVTTNALIDRARQLDHGKAPANSVLPTPIASFLKSGISLAVEKLNRQNTRMDDRHTELINKLGQIILNPALTSSTSTPGATSPSDLDSRTGKRVKVNPPDVSPVNIQTGN